MKQRVFANLSQDWIIFIIVSSIVVFLLIAMAIIIPVFKKIHQNRFKEYYYKKINRIVLDNDYYLINNFVFKNEKNRAQKVNHIIFGEKYIYLIFDYYYEGDLAGDIRDKSLIFYPFKKNNDAKKKYTDNPVLVASSAVQSLSYITLIQKSMFIGIVLINDEVNCSIASDSSQFYVIQRKRLKALIKAIESRDVSKINEEQLAKVVKDFARINRKKKK